MPLREKKTFFNVRKKVPLATKPRGWGAKGLSGRVTKIIIVFCVFPKSEVEVLFNWISLREGSRKKVLFLVYSPLRPYLAPLPSA